MLGYDGAKAKAVMAVVELEAKSIRPRQFMSRSAALELFAQYETLTAAVNAGTAAGGATPTPPGGAGKCFQTDLERKWTFMNNQGIYVTSAVSGSLVGLALAFVVIGTATRSVRVSLSATATIACTLVSVIGFMTMMGWKVLQPAPQPALQPVQPAPQPAPQPVQPAPQP